MRDEVRGASVGIVALIGLMVLSFNGVSRATPQEPANLPQIISRAKSEVFPALIFVKPIVADYDSGEKKQQEVFGSGIIVSGDGYAVTNWHVVDKAVTINCVLFDKRQVEVELIGSDRDTDLALLKLPDLPSGQAYPYAAFADTARVEEGDFVMALGSPFGFQRSISLGIISNAQRYIGFESEHKYNTWFQTDAAINPGNSGGPLIDTRGHIIGINTLGISGSGLGFSIPASMVQSVIAKLKEDGRVIRAYTGLRLQALKDFQSNTFVNGDHGVLITGVEENSPAAKAGIRAGDILRRIDEQVVDGRYAEMLPAIWCRLADLPVGNPVSLELGRGGETFEAAITPEQKGELEGEDLGCPRWNMTIKEINKYQTPRLYYIQKNGVYIQGVRRPGNAVSSGLGHRDIIVKIDRKSVETIEQVKQIYEQIIKDEQREKKVLFEILRGGLRKWIVLDYRHDYDEE